ncbi:MAG: glycosyltransferase [Pseudomonadota bacterium]
MARREPAVSVIIPARDAEASIGGTLRSLAADTAVIGEVILVDDASRDDTVDLAREAARTHGLPLSVLQVGVSGAGAARNAGLAAARFPFIHFLDADDRMEPGGISALHEALVADPNAGIAIGANLRRTEGRPDKPKSPDGYGGDRRRNVHDYLLGRMWPIAMGSAMVRREHTDGIRFPEDATLDEDTCFWAQLMARNGVAIVEQTALVYALNEARMARRYAAAPKRTFLGVARALSRLGEAIDDRAASQWRKAWVALRIARQLIYERRFDEARFMLRAVAAHPAFAQSRRLARYRVEIALGSLRTPARRPRSVPISPAGTFRTLVLTIDAAWPPVSGADLRNVQNALAALAHGPVLLASVRPLISAAPTPPGLEVASAAKQGADIWASIAEAADGVGQRVREFRPDAVIVEGVSLSALMPQLYALAPVVILDMHNVESHLSAQVARVAPRRSLKGLLGLHERAIRRRERRALRHADRVWVCSEADASRLYRSHHPSLPIDVVPNGVPRLDSVPRYLPAIDGQAGGPTILFLGHLGYRPNVVAARRLALGIAPIVRASLPSAQLVLAGRSPHRRITELADTAGIRLIADPPDVAALLGEADIVAVPLDAGGGTRLKILEAMAWGLPVVASPIAVDGLALDADIDFVSALSDADFAREIIALWSDRERFKALRRQAHETVMHRFGTRAVERAVRQGLGLLPQPPVPQTGTEDAIGSDPG